MRLVSDSMDTSAHADTPTPTLRGQAWDTAAYAAQGRFVADLAGAVVELLAPQPGEAILDLGCGDGALTERLAAMGATLTGVDSSTAMLVAASRRGLRVFERRAEQLGLDGEFGGEFDAVFSNAALHWIRDAAGAIAGVHRVLRPGGRFVAEMGGHGNIAAIRVALQCVLARYGIDAEETAASFFPSPTHYARLLREGGFTVQTMELNPRPTPLPAGMEGWLNTFRNGVLDLLPPADRTKALVETVAMLEPVLRDADGRWSADYVRLRFSAVRE